MKNNNLTSPVLSYATKIVVEEKKMTTIAKKLQPILEPLMKKVAVEIEESEYEDDDEDEAEKEKERMRRLRNINRRAHRGFS